MWACMCEYVQEPELASEAIPRDAVHLAFGDSMVHLACNLRIQSECLAIRPQGSTCLSLPA